MKFLKVKVLNFVSTHTCRVPRVQYFVTSECSIRMFKHYIITHITIIITHALTEQITCKAFRGYMLINTIRAGEFCRKNKNYNLSHSKKCSMT